MEQTQNAMPEIKKEITPVFELIGKSVKIYREGFKKLVGMSLVGFLGIIPFLFIVVMFTAASYFFKGNNNLTANVVAIILGLLSIAAILFLVYVAVISKIGIFLILKEFPTTRKIKDIFMEARNYFWQYCVVGLITSIIIVLWTLLFIIPGIIFGVYYGFSYFAL
ncbi:MAG: hypothetical protein V1860_02815, partial [bacterium]